MILGSGWGGYSILKKIDTKNYDVVVVSPRLIKFFIKNIQYIFLKILLF